MTDSPTAPHQDRIFLGIAYGMVAFFMFAVMNASAKWLTQTHHITEIGFWRCFIAALPVLAYILITHQFTLFKVNRPWLLLMRTLIGNIGLIFTFGAMQNLPMADATLLFLCSTLITPILAFFFLNERMGLRRWIAIIIGLGGVALLVQPSGEVKLLGILMGCAAAFTHASVQVTLRALKEENSVTVTFYFLIGGALMMTPFLPFTASGITTSNELLLIMAVGGSGALAQICLTFAFKNAPANTVSPFNFSGLLWATIFDIVIWSYIPGWPVFLGGAIMIGAKLYILHREKLHANKNTQQNR